MVKLIVSYWIGKISRILHVLALAAPVLPTDPVVKDRTFRYLTAPQIPPDPVSEEGTRVETISQQAARLSSEWQTDPRWKDTARTYSAEDVVRLRGSIQEEYTLARRGAERLRKLLAEEDAVTALGALTGNQAVQQVKAGLKAIYLSGWQVAADANLAGQTYPDQSLYPVNSVPQVARRINHALLPADHITWAESAHADAPHWLAPLVADSEA